VEPRKEEFFALVRLPTGADCQMSHQCASVSLLQSECKRSGQQHTLNMFKSWEEQTLRIYQYYCEYSGPDSSVGIAIGYRLEGPGIESRWGRDFPPIQTGTGAHPASYTMGTGSFLWVKCGRGVLLTTDPLLAPRSWKSRAIPLPSSGPQPGL